MREIKVRIHARMSRKKVRSGHLSPWIFLVFIDTLLILVWTYTVSLGKILFFGDFNAGKDWKNTLCIFQDQEGFFLLSKDFFATSMAFPPFFSWPLLTRSRRKKDGIFTSDMYWAWGNLPAKKAKFYFPFLSPRCLSGSKAVLFCSFSPFLLRKKIFKRSRPPFMGCKGDRIEPKIMFGDKKRFSYKNRTSFREKKIMPAFFSLHPLHHVDSTLSFVELSTTEHWTQWSCNLFPSPLPPSHASSPFCSWARKRGRETRFWTQKEGFDNISHEKFTLKILFPLCIRSIHNLNSLSPRLIAPNLAWKTFFFSHPLTYIPPTPKRWSKQQLVAMGAPPPFFLLPPPFVLLRRKCLSISHIFLRENWVCAPRFFMKYGLVGVGGGPSFSRGSINLSLVEMGKVCPWKKSGRKNKWRRSPSFPI